MGIFNRKKDRILDLTEKNNEISPTQKSKEQTNASSDGFSFFNAMSNSAKQTEDYPVLGSGTTENTEDKRRKLAKRLTDITERLEELSNQLYHLQQRVELLERKTGINF